MAEASLPKQFAQLERFAGKWDLPDYNSRYEERVSSSMEELQDFCEEVEKCAEEVKTYLDGKSFEDYTDADRRLARVMLSYPLAAQSAEIYKQPRVPDAGTRMFNVKIHPEI